MLVPLVFKVFPKGCNDSKCPIAILYPARYFSVVNVIITSEPASFRVMMTAT